mmetsp:Transcript_6684/g.19425  ORF Transcript_6684/g.19425 Transcript_6684/m.19425 type:complete len:359 (+) Transcript_6684:291-1367(+)
MQARPLSRWRAGPLRRARHAGRQALPARAHLAWAPLCGRGRRGFSDAARDPALRGAARRGVTRPAAARPLLGRAAVAGRHFAAGGRRAAAAGLGRALSRSRPDRAADGPAGAAARAAAARLRGGRQPARGVDDARECSRPGRGGGGAFAGGRGRRCHHRAAVRARVGRHRRGGRLSAAAVGGATPRARARAQRRVRRLQGVWQRARRRGGGARAAPRLEPHAGRIRDAPRRGRPGGDWRAGRRARGQPLRLPLRHRPLGQRRGGRGLPARRRAALAARRAARGAQVGAVRRRARGDGDGPARRRHAEEPARAAAGRQHAGRARLAGPRHPPPAGAQLDRPRPRRDRSRAGRSVWPRRR